MEEKETYNVMLSLTVCKGRRGRRELGFYSDRDVLIFNLVSRVLNFIILELLQNETKNIQVIISTEIKKKPLWRKKLC